VLAAILLAVIIAGAWVIATYLIHSLNRHLDQ
jgi:hypothetical protein